jgi:hypothetical protein
MWHSMSCIELGRDLHEIDVAIFLPGISALASCICTAGKLQSADDTHSKDRAELHRARHTASIDQCHT